MYDGLVTFKATICRSYLPQTGDEFEDYEAAKAYFEEQFRVSLERYAYETEAELLDIETEDAE